MWTARQAGLVVTSIDQELIVFDQDRQALHRLNPLAALVWQAADGQTPVGDMLRIAGEQIHPGVSPEAIGAALRMLAEADLLAGGSELVPLPSRRRLMRNLAVGAAVMPSVISLTAPAAADAASVTCVRSPQPLVWMEFRSVTSDASVCTPRVYATGYCANTNYQLVLTVSVFGGNQLNAWSTTVTANDQGQVVVSPIGTYNQNASLVFVATVDGVASGPYSSVCQN